MVSTNKVLASGIVALVMISSGGYYGTLPQNIREEKGIYQGYSGTHGILVNGESYLKDWDLHLDTLKRGEAHIFTIETPNANSVPIIGRIFKEKIIGIKPVDSD